MAAFALSDKKELGRRGESYPSRTPTQPHPKTPMPSRDASLQAEDSSHSQANTGISSQFVVTQEKGQEMEEEDPGGPGTGEAASIGPHPIQSGSGIDFCERAGPEILAQDSITSDVDCQRFQLFSYHEADGPREVCSQLHGLCNQWLKPERHSKKQMVDLVILEQFLTLLPQEMQSWVRGCGPESSSQAVALAEGFLLSQAQEKRQAEQVRGSRFSPDLSCSFFPQTHSCPFPSAGCSDRALA
ncbi:putative SCAN domain-containing protein SCAND2P [Heteronotia binoei]|uniref:putative SCAN domain-containing protein SCAND2P n=1 Tax=Heteronotia binoei TaxID=13085 RepID=UPI00292EAA28|nr:putative SCAN domain-containing protein SCAND2P [Heteronotia binoei]